MSPYAAVALDLDGTLLRSDGTLSGTSVMTLRALARRRHRIVYVTARHLAAARLVADQIGIPADVASCLGAALHELPGGELVRDWPLSAETAKAVADRLGPAAPGTSFGWVEQGEAHVQATYPHPFGTARIAASADCLPTRPVAKLFARNVTAEPGMFWEAAVEAAAAAGATPLAASPGLAEFVAPTVDKGAVLRAWCSIRGVDPLSVVAFGDSPPDLPLLTTAGLGVAVGNAVPQVQAAADVVVGSNDDDGVALMLHRLFQLDVETEQVPTDAFSRGGPSPSKRHNVKENGMSEHWDDNFLDALREYLPDAESLVELDAEASLADLGLDSINMISLMMRLEGDYDISFPEEAVSFSTFATPITLWTTVRELRASEVRPA